LFRSPQLTSGRVEAAKLTDGVLTFRGASYRASQEEPPDACTSEGTGAVRYVLARGDRRQMVATGLNCSRFDLRWAGDLDRDGKLDLLLEEDLEGGLVLRLYLSGPAIPPDFVKEVASVSYGGC